MFDIKYRIVDDLDYLVNVSTQQFDTDGIDIEGFFTLNFNGNIEGDYHDNKLDKFEVGHELITLWFDLLIEVILILKEKSGYVALKEIECFDSWIEFILDDDILIVSSARYSENNNNNDSFIITSKKDGFKYLTWKGENISFSEFKDKVKAKANEYLSEIERINPSLLNTKIISKLVKQLQLI